jgi:hypothetical protein
MDTETLGLDIDAPIWEFAAIRRGPLGPDDDIVERQLHIQIHHYADPWMVDFPAEFAADYRKRFDAGSAYGQSGAAQVISSFLAGRPHIVGAVPDFDTSKIRHQLLRPARIPDPWHYHLIDVETLASGYLAGCEARYDGGKGADALALPWKSDDLSRRIGVDPEQFDRHTAMGDVLWVKAQYDAVMGGVIA